jgi:hypothetical protein
MNNFEKEAQKRSVTKMLGRSLNPMEWIRQMSSSKYRRLIAAVDAVDKAMRDNITRLKPSLRDQLHQARMAMKNRDFLRVFQYANSILDSVNGVFIDQIDELDTIGSEIYSEFSQNTMDDFERQQLEEQLGVRKVPRVAASPDPELIIEAGVTQWLQEKIPTKKELEGVLFDKIFKNIQGKQQNAAREAMAIAESTYALIDQAFAVLDDNRRNIMEYVRLAREYQKKLGNEKEHLKRMYIANFPAEPAKPAEVSQPQITPPAAAPTSPVPPTPPPVPSAGPILSGNPPSQKAAKDVNDMIANARTAILNGHVGIGTALLAQASELCDQLGDEQRSISLLKTAVDLDRIRGQAIDVCIYDVVQDLPRFSKERVAEAFNRGYKNPEQYLRYVGTPKVMVDGKEVK